MRRVFFSTALLAGIMLCGCTAEELILNPVVQKKGLGFTLTANYGDEGTKVTFDEDGLNMTWQPGDVLYLVDVADKNSTVTLTTDIKEASKTASFTTDKSVLSGEYVVLYGQNTLSISKDISMKSITDLNSQIRLYGALTVTDGQTAASITLKQLYAMLTFKFKNLPGGLTDMCLGMAVTEGGTKTLETGTISQEGLATTSSYSHNVKFSWNSGADSKALIAPVDFSGSKTYFFIYGTNTSGQHVTYEFQKDGKNLVAGKNYNLTFDFSKATKVSTLSKSSVNSDAYVLTTPEQFRDAAYWGTSNSYSVEDDVDFSGEVYFPIPTSHFYGNKHTLSNITVKLSECDYVGIVSKGTADNIKVKDSSFSGNQYVGSIIGQVTTQSTINGCCGDGVAVNGEAYVGGLIGHTYISSAPISTCSLIGTSSVTATGESNGCSYVGGIVGYINTSSISKCLIKGTISITGGSNYTGGIVGYACGEVSECGFEGTVEGKASTGGIAGCWGKNGWSINKCYVFGDVRGTNYVGGIGGNSYSNSYSSYIYNSYHIGNTTGNSYNVGGISGHDSWYNNYCYYYNCYSYGTVSSGYGISQYINTSYYTKNLTSCSALSSYATSSNYADYCNCGPGKTFLSKISVINGNEAYSTQVWKDNDAGCPLLQWQAEGFGGDVVIPGFDEEDW